MLIVLIVVASVTGCVAYFVMTGEDQSSETIKIGVLADLDNTLGSNIWKAAVLAADQINAEGGILGKQVKVIGEDSDVATGVDAAKITLALTRLINYHKVDYIIGENTGEVAFVCQDIAAEHKKIFVGLTGNQDELTLRVLDDYEKYKYFFRVWPSNVTTIGHGTTDVYNHIREITGFNRIGYLAEDHVWTKGIIDQMEYLLPEVLGFDLVYGGTFPPFSTLDFSSYLAAAEAAETEILVPLIILGAEIPFIKEWYNRQSPMIIYGGALTEVTTPEGWNWTDGNCEHITTLILPVTAGYPLTTKTLPFRDSYMDRWGEYPFPPGAAAYDTIRFILYDAIMRAGTIETEAVIQALEETSIETTMAKNFVFTSSHDLMVGQGDINDPNDDHVLSTLFQWQSEGELAPIYPKQLMEEAGVTYTFPDWSGPWD